MPISLKNLREIPCQTLSGKKIGTVNSAIIDHETGKILAWQLKLPLPNLLSPVDIVASSVFRIILNDEYQLHPPDDLVRVKKILDTKQKIISLPVRTQSGMQLGKCIDLMLDIKQNMLAGIITSKKILAIFPKLTLLIAHKSIIEITEKEIIVQDSLLKLPIFNSLKKSSTAMASFSPSTTSR